MENKYSNRKIYFLKDILQKDYFASLQADNALIESTMKEDSLHPDDSSKMLSHAILDIKDVNISPRGESRLYDWISYYDLVVYDTTVEDHDVVFTVSKGQYKPDGTQAEQDEVIELKAGDPIRFRHDALMKFRETVERSRIALDLSVFQHTIGDTPRFTTESSKEVIKALSEIQQSLTNKNERIYVNPSNINYEDESTVREVSALLIRLFRNIRIDNSNMKSIACSRHILPAIGQLCFDYSTFLRAMVDIKTKLPVGTKLPVIYGQKLYIVNITENPPLPDDFDLEKVTEEELSKFMYLKVRDVLVNEQLEIINDDLDSDKLLSDAELSRLKSNVTKKNKKENHEILRDLSGSPTELLVDAGKISRREVIFIPPAIAGIRLPDNTLDLSGMPDVKTELSFNYKNSVISKPSAIWLNPDDFIYASYEGEMKAGADYISICRKQEREFAERHGQKKDFVDLLDVFNDVDLNLKGGSLLD